MHSLDVAAKEHAQAVRPVPLLALLSASSPMALPVKVSSEQELRRSQGERRSPLQEWASPILWTLVLKAG